MSSPGLEPTVRKMKRLSPLRGRILVVAGEMLGPFSRILGRLSWSQHQRHTSGAAFLPTVGRSGTPRFGGAD